jgi:hypothetical protein
MKGGIASFLRLIAMSKFGLCGVAWNGKPFYAGNIPPTNIVEIKTISFA